MAKLVFGMNQSLDGYVDHMAFAPGPTLFRLFIEEARHWHTTELGLIDEYRIYLHPVGLVTASPISPGLGRRCAWWLTIGSRM